MRKDCDGLNILYIENGGHTYADQCIIYAGQYSQRRTGGMTNFKTVKKIKATAIISILFIVIAVLPQYRSHEHKQFEKIWNIEPPQGKEVYCKEHTDFFYGNRNAFIVYEAQSRPNYSFYYEKNEEMEEKVREISERLEIAGRERPDFSESYWWGKKIYKNGSSLIILYFPEEEKYYFVEEYFNI